MNTQLLFGVAVVPAVVGLVEVCKDLGLPGRAAPAAAVLFGVLAALAQLYAGQWAWIQAAVVGVAMGLSACGLYAGAKTVAAKATGSNTPDAAPVQLREITPAPIGGAAPTPVPAPAAPPRPARPRKPRAPKTTPAPAPTDGRTGG